MNRKFWRERIKKDSKYFPTVYNIYIHGDVHTSKLVDENALKTLEDAEHVLKTLIEDPTTEWTHGIIYEVRPIVRRGTSYTSK